jgi:hypothetical protein
MPGEFDQITNALKNAYPDVSVEAMVNEETPFRKALNRNVPAGSRSAGEGILKFGANFAPPQNVGATNDGASYPVPVDRTQDQLTLRPQMFVGSFQIGQITKVAANTNKGAFNGGELRRRTEETITDLGKHMERIYSGTHGTGRVAVLDGVTAPTTTTFRVRKPELATLLKENLRITVRTTDGGNTRTGATNTGPDNVRITIVDRATGDVTYTPASNEAASTAAHHVHVVTEATQVIAPNWSSAGTSNVPFGLRGAVDDGTLAPYWMELSRTTYPKLKGTVKSNAGSLRNLTEQLLINTCHEIRQVSGKRPTDIWTNTGQVEKYIEFVAPDRRYTVAGSGVQGMGTGYKEDSLVHYAPGVSLKFNIGLEIIPRELYLLNWETFFLYRAKALGWWDEGEMLKPLPGTNTYKTAFFAGINAVENMGCTMPLANAVLKDLRDPLIGD